MNREYNSSWDDDNNEEILEKKYAEWNYVSNMGGDVYRYWKRKTA